MTAGAFDPTWDLIRYLDLNLLNRWYLSVDSGGPELAKAIAGSPAVQRITELNVRACALGDEGVDYLVGSRYSRSLRSLNLAFNMITSRGLIFSFPRRYSRSCTRSTSEATQLPLMTSDAFSSPPWPANSTPWPGRKPRDRRARPDLRLSRSARALELMALKISWPTNPAADQRVASVITSLRSRPQSLAIDADGYQRPCEAPETVAALGRRSSVRHLRDLRIQNLKIGDEGARYLASADFRLRSLSLFATEIGCAGARVLATSDAFLALEKLDLDVGDDGGESLATSKFIPRLSSLGITCIEPGAAPYRQQRARSQEMRRTSMSSS